MASCQAQTEPCTGRRQLKLARLGQSTDKKRPQVGKRRVAVQFNSPAGWPREGFWPIKLCRPATRCAGKEQDAGGGNERLRRQAFLVRARRPDRGGDCGCDLAAQQNRGSFPGGDDASSSNAKSAVAYAGIPAKVAAGQKFARVQISLSAFKARISCARASSIARSPPFVAASTNSSAWVGKR
jgi:hypothetical protein